MTIALNAAATGVGSLPGTDVFEATNLVFGETNLPYLPELPGRGPGADMIGRTMALLSRIDPAFSVTTTPTGWRLNARPGRDVRRALAWFGEDLDALEQYGSAYAGLLKVSLAGPLTLAAAVEVVSGEKVLRDEGARRDLAAALAELSASLVADVRRRVAGAQVIVQLDEPSLQAAVAGAIPSASGLTSLKPIEPVEAQALLRDIVESVHGVDAYAAVHSCAARPPFELWRRVGFDAVSFDATLLTDSEYDEIGETFDAGLGLIFGAVPTQRASTPDDAVRIVSTVQRELAFSDDVWFPQVAVSPTCGLGTLDPSAARGIIDTVKKAARVLRSDEALRVDSA